MAVTFLLSPPFEAVIIAGSFNSVAIPRLKQQGAMKQKNTFVKQPALRLCVRTAKVVIWGEFHPFC